MTKQDNDPQDFETRIRRLQVEPPSASFEDSHALMRYLHGAEEEAAWRFADGLDSSRQAQRDAFIEGAAWQRNQVAGILSEADTVSWEYRVLELGYNENDELNKMGVAGWELVTVIYRNGLWSLAYFKRRAALSRAEQDGGR